MLSRSWCCVVGVPDSESDSLDRQKVELAKQVDGSSPPRPKVEIAGPGAGRLHKTLENGSSSKTMLAADWPCARYTTHRKVYGPITSFARGYREGDFSTAGWLAHFPLAAIPSTLSWVRSHGWGREFNIEEPLLFTFRPVPVSSSTPVSGHHLPPTPLFDPPSPPSPVASHHRPDRLQPPTWPAELPSMPSG